MQRRNDKNLTISTNFLKLEHKNFQFSKLRLLNLKLSLCLSILEEQ